MASYNGEQYIKNQISSILEQLTQDDELIIVDDCSSDSTVEIIKAFTALSIKLYHNNINIGYVKTFEKAVSLSKNNIICLADQDDIWIKGRLELLYQTLKKENVLVVASNFQVKNESQNNVKFLKLKHEDSKDLLGNIKRIFLGRSAYYGCTMMIDRKIFKYILPFPIYTEAHDLWIAMTANLLKSIYHLNDNTLVYRVHQNNSSLKKRKLTQKLIARYYFCKNILIILKRINKFFLLFNSSSTL
ncbi:MAG: kfoC 1 [Chryseobacterium sp.]|jgi:glycosyltransferase involved in cell wall biosynthesis|nr:kfoC 1 [Chryseobacterium sp.]